MEPAHTFANLATKHGVCPTGTIIGTSGCVLKSCSQGLNTTTGECMQEARCPKGTEMVRTQCMLKPCEHGMNTNTGECYRLRINDFHDDCSKWASEGKCEGINSEKPAVWIAHMQKTCKKSCLKIILGSD